MQFELYIVIIYLLMMMLKVKSILMNRSLINRYNVRRSLNSMVSLNMNVQIQIKNYTYLYIIMNIKRN